MLCLFAAPLWFGGRHDLGRLIYAVLVATAALAWAARCYLRRDRPKQWSPAHSLLLAGIAAVGLQLAPLPPSLLGAMSPGLVELAPLWNLESDASFHLGQWRTLSVTPSATRIGLAVLVSHTLLLFVVVERLNEGVEVRRLLRAVALAAGFMSVFALLQWLTSNGKLLWFYPHPQREIGEWVQGSFANKNHFAHFVALGVAPTLLAWHEAAQRLGAIRSKKNHEEENRRLLICGAWGVLAVVEVTAVFLSLSRGGLASLTIGVATAAPLFWRAGMLGRRQAWGFAGVAVAALTLLSLGDFNRVANRFDDLAAGSFEEIDKGGARRLIWAANVAAFQANPWLGYGVGSHPEVHHAFISEGHETEFTHAETGYLHTTTEAGLLGGVLVCAGILFIGSWCLRGLLYETDANRLADWGAVVTGLMISAVHSVGDFVWYIPSCMTVTLLLVACALRLHQTRRPGEPLTTPNNFFPAARLALTPLAAVLAVAALWGPGRGALAWDRYLRASGQHRDLVANQMQNLGASDSSTPEMAALLQLEMIDALQETISHNPGNARAHLRLAGRQLQQFGVEQRDAPNALGLVHIREAALASRFASRGATLDWLRTAFGDEADRLLAAYKHTRLGLSLSPLQGDGYGYLADLCYLAPPIERDVAAMLDQAVRVRPYDGGVLFQAGKQSMIAGEAQQAVEYWKRAHRLPGLHRFQIVAKLAPLVPADDYLTDFEPGWESLYALYHVYQEKGAAADLHALAVYAKEMASQTTSEPLTNRRSARALVLASEIHRQLDEHQESVLCAEQAAEILPTTMLTRRALAAAYVGAERFDDAEPHLRWCLSRSPGDRYIREWLRLTHEKKLAAKRTWLSPTRATK